METSVFLFSLSALGILYAMNTIPELQEPYVILGTGVAVLVVVFLFYFLITRRNPPKDALFFVFAEFSFTCVIDLTSALEYDGIISGFMNFYQKTGEPYLGTAYAIMMCYWDGIAHFIMYLVMISRITDRKAYRNLGLLWAGSLCANMSVFIAGIVAGKYGSEIRPAFWLNFLFLLMPVWGAVTLFTRPKDRPLIGGYNAQHAQSMKLIWRPLDLILVLLLLAAMAFTVLRGLVALDSPLEACSVYLKHYEPYLKDPVGFPRVMMLHFFFYGLPLFGSFVYGLLKPGCTWMSDWTVFCAGAMIQCQWAHIGGSLHPRTTAPFHIPHDVFWCVLAANLLYMVTPILVALRVQSNPYFFLKISPFPGQTGLPNSEEKDTKYKDK
ncbi:transmembrane 6 superfamily member 2 [Hippoglossus hippoglossus]|uniref:transmembrane 6 superfamily member 2 n=1 Tax=Hippoglossus hippoglossus TaxID=8267 RepID=UPI00148DB931|nr:transmembrane 6 superfamily member 2 [Hippoglossus hippoglossus]XP_034438776.1 transmembrane 6 superfamily member 2 [Hippoglossus hippoglossus]XP_047198752.1 transmembrane 6 superfamily member 2b [Hippoglossus stenolepis]